MPEIVRSADGCRIAYERHGTGPALIIAPGAFGDRVSARRHAPALGSRFTVYCYDRRGRGDSEDHPPYAIEREVEDLDALVGAVGEPVFVYGHSSGGALVLEAAARGVPVTGVAVYEAPYLEGAAASFAQTLTDLVAAGRRSEAAERFMLNTGAPQPAVDGMKASPWWTQAQALAHTLPYEVLLCNDGSVPVQRLAQISCPALVMVGGLSSEGFSRAARSIAAAVPKATMRVVPDQAHGISGEALAPILEEFFFEGR